MSTTDAEPHQLTITGRGPASWGDCSCGWFSGPGLTLAPPRKAIQTAHASHVEREAAHHA